MKAKTTEGECVDCGSSVVLVNPKTELPSKRCPDCFLDAIQEAMLLSEAEEILTTGKVRDEGPDCSV